MAKQGLPKTAALEEVEILFPQDTVCRELFESLADRVLEDVIGHFEVVGFPEILQSMTLGVLDELREVERFVEFTEFVVIQMTIAVFDNALRLGLEPEPVIVFRILCVSEESDERTGLFDAFLGTLIYQSCELLRWRKDL